MLYKVLSMVVGPEASWSRFSRKVISILLAASIGAVAWNKYTEYTNPILTEQSVAFTLLEEDKRRQVQKELENLLKILPGARGVWLYDWPDARTVRPTMRAGEGPDPFPLGYLRDGDQHAIGSWVLGECADVPRAQSICACPINGTWDAWGVLVVTYDDHPPANPSAVQVVAQKISNILYHN